MKKIVILHSEAATWELAKLEWSLMFIDEIDNHCICGHEIYENCYIRNELNGTELIVGNHCINEFIDQDYSNVFNCLKRIRKNPSVGKPNEALLEYLHNRSLIKEDTYHRAMRLRRKRKFPSDDRTWLTKLNMHIIRIFNEKRHLAVPS